MQLSFDLLAEKGTPWIAISLLATTNRASIKFIYKQNRLGLCNYLAFIVCPQKRRKASARAIDIGVIVVPGQVKSKQEHQQNDHQKAHRGHLFASISFKETVKYFRNIAVILLIDRCRITLLWVYIGVYDWISIVIFLNYIPLSFGYTTQAWLYKT